MSPRKAGHDKIVEREDNCKKIFNVTVMTTRFRFLVIKHSMIFCEYHNTCILNIE